MKKIGVSGYGAGFLFLSLVAMEVDPVKVQPGDIGNKSANLVFLRDNLVQLRPSLQEQGYDVAVPDFVPVTTDEAQQFLRAQHVSLDARWRAAVKRGREEITSQVECTEACAPEGDQELCKRLCLPGGKFEKLSGVIKNPAAKRKHEYRSRQRPLKKSSAVLSGAIHDFIKKAHEGGWRLMVRSTGKEDSEEFSNAGGNESFANVSPDFASVKAAMNGVIASYVAPKSMMQRSEAQEDVFSKPYTPVLLQRMIGEDLNGALDSARVPVGCVVYTQEPFGNTPGVSLIQASFGHNEGVVNSTVATDSFYVDEHGNVRAVIKKKPQRIIPTFDGTKYKLEFKSNPAELQNAPALTDADARIVKRVSDAIQSWYGKPMDVELIFERHTKTVYLVQARPLQVVKQMRPQYLETVQEGALIRGTTVNPDNCSVRHITNAQQLIIAPTLNDALDIFNAPGFQTKQVQAVVVQADAEATSHAAAIFRGAGKPIFRINDLDMLRDWLKEEKTSLFLDVQREVLVRAPEAMTVSGWFTHPMPLALSVEQQGEMAEALSVSLADYFPGESTAVLIEKLKAEDDATIATEIQR